MKIDDRGRALTYIVIIVCAVVAALAGLIYLGTRYTKGMDENAHAFFQKLSENKFDAAYALTSKEFQAATSLAQLTERSQGFDRIKIEWGDDHRDGENRKSIDVVFINSEGARAPISLAMVREDDTWKVQAVDPRKPEEKPEEQKEEEEETLPGYSWLINWSTARIAEVFMTSDLSGAPSTRTDVFPQDVERIYCMIKLAYAPDSTDVSSKWIFIGGPGSELKNYDIATDTIESKGHDEINFYVSRPEKGFPKGDYLLKLFIDGRKKKEIPFTVK